MKRTDIMNQINDLTLLEINQIKDNKLRDYLQEYYKEQLLELTDTKISKKIVQKYIGYSLNDILKKIEETYFEYESIYLFPGDLVIVYPNIREYKSRKTRICDISGAEIVKGSYYYHYRLLLENISDKTVFTLERPLIAETGYYDFFPTNIQELDELAQKLDNSDLLEESEYNYYDISSRIGGSLKLRKLK